ncbi:MAG: cell division protein ZapA [Bacteroidales bacterium]
MREQNISVIIADRPYRLSVSGEEEEQMLRKAGQQINDKLQEYADNYAYRDKQDLLAMIGLQFSVELLSNDNKGQYQKSLIERLVDIDKQLNEYLEKV